MISGLINKRSVFTLLMVLYSAGLMKAQDVSRDQKLGAEGKTMVETTMGIYEDTVKTKILGELGTKLASNLENKLFDYEFHIVDMGEPNAFALPGGYIYFTRGILALANSEDELAGVMGHEIIHSNNRHSIKQMKTGILSGILSLPEAVAGVLLGENAGRVFTPLTKGGKAIGATHSRKDEYEADKLGVELSARSGYNPASLATMLNNLNTTIEVYTGKKEQPNYFSSHPLTAKRTENIAKESAKLKTSDLPKLFNDQKEFLKFIDGIIVGPNPKQGVFQGDWFIHPELDFRFKVPKNWLKENTPSAVATGDSTGSAVVMLGLEGKYKTAEEAASNFASEIQKKTGKSVEMASKNINGYSCKSVTFKSTQKNQSIDYCFYWIEYNNLLYKFTGAAAPGFEKPVTEIIESFSKPTTAELQSITVKRLKVVECLSGDNIQTLSTREKNVLSADMTAAVNSVSIDKVFAEGELIKVVVQVPYHN